MANGLDRLERLFAYKRKQSPSPNGRADRIVQPIELQFPSASFIRPKTSRMTARQEIHLRQAAERSPSVPDIFGAQRAVHSRTYGSVSTDTNCELEKRLVRSPSFTHRQAENLVSGLQEFQFPTPPSRNGDTSPVSLTFDTTNLDQVPRLPSPRSRSPLHISIPSYRLDTPPSSDPEDNGSNSPSPTTKGPQNLLPVPACLPTPDESPEIRPVPDSQLRSVKSVDDLDKALAIEDQFGESFDQQSLGRTYSQSSITYSTHSFCSSSLREPDFNEFFNLSDDDIAESTPNSPDLEPVGDDVLTLPPMELSISASVPLTSSLLTLSPPRASRPAAAAAFEAARIARRYDFDLVYVVNLWPETSQYVSTADKPMVGRLLAAHGLHHVPSPLQVSADVHMHILRTHGWIEYRNNKPQPQDLSRGYGCAFYTGQYARSNSLRPASPVSGVRLSEKIDRGIVFAAYRKPCEGVNKLGRSFSHRELGELHRDAEALVEMVIDIHVANRSRQPPTRSSLADDIGPIPAQQIEVA
ncbi:hypothetical protein QQS21_011872 [Conoideocrella luteorostrata]|uniref:Uncharacterized protein n=1 Tax=Conoideocrella luteorostrata TaxID=1105319 RepID=A0AAJ0FMX9_9HYPO|nr:hypothetical protein QQS21_011872 [Conoideocrella luteorostrata]